MIPEDKILETVDRFLNNQMSENEKIQFNHFRESNSELDQFVVEHKVFMQNLHSYSDQLALKNNLQIAQQKLITSGEINVKQLKLKPRIILFWNRYKREVGIAAMIAGITTLSITGLIHLFTLTNENTKVQTLVNKVNEIDEKTKNLGKRLETVDQKASHSFNNTMIRYNGTGFLIDGKGYLVTNAHVVKNSKNIFIQNSKGEKLNALIAHVDLLRDIAILKIDDSDYKPIALPYSIKKTGSEIAEPVFTLGYPRHEIVYGEGYLSSITGYNGDTLTYQIAVVANPGNSGAPIFNNYGEVIGILSTKELQTDGAVFAIRSKYIYDLVNEIKQTNNTLQQIHISNSSQLKNTDKKNQVKKIQDYIYMVKGD